MMAEALHADSIERRGNLVETSATAPTRTGTRHTPIEVRTTLRYH